MRYGRQNDPAEADRAIAALEFMFGEGQETTNGLWRTRAMIPLREHPEFSRLVQEERSLSNNYRGLPSYGFGNIFGN